MKQVLVTGGMGFIGNHLVNHLLSLGFGVLVLDKSIHKPTFHDIRQATIIEGDVLSRELLRDCLEKVDVCFHLAALSSIPLCNRDWIFAHENNVLAFNGLLDQIRQTSHPVKLIYASSSAVYGDSKVLCSESDHIRPISTYGADKVSNEIYAEAIRELYGVPSIGLRLFNVYGPSQLKANSYSAVITNFKLALDDNQPLTIYGDGKQTRDFIYIQDVIDAFILALETPSDQSGVFNVCSSCAVSIEELAQIMKSLSTHKPPITYLAERTGDLRYSVGNNMLAKKVLNFVAKIPIDKGIELILKSSPT